MRYREDTPEQSLQCAISKVLMDVVVTLTTQYTGVIIPLFLRTTVVLNFYDVWERTNFVLGVKGQK